MASEAPSTERDGNRWALLYTTAPTLDPTVSQMTIVTTGDERILEQILKQLNKLIDVIKVIDFTDGSGIELLGDANLIVKSAMVGNRGVGILARVGVGTNTVARIATARPRQPNRHRLPVGLGRPRLRFAQARPRTPCL
mgnify:CR=1 FL=1